MRSALDMTKRWHRSYGYGEEMILSRCGKSGCLYHDDLRRSKESLRSHRFAEILAGIEEEERATEGVTWKELLLPVNRRRVLIVVFLQIGKIHEAMSLFQVCR